MTRKRILLLALLVLTAACKEKFTPQTGPEINPGPPLRVLPTIRVLPEGGMEVVPTGGVRRSGRQAQGGGAAQDGVQWADETLCVFCRSNRETRSYYTGHKYIYLLYSVYRNSPTVRYCMRYCSTLLCCTPYGTSTGTRMWTVYCTAL